MQDFGLLIPDRIRAKRDRRLHGREADELHDVIGHHVAQRPRLVVVAAPLLYAPGFSNTDLHAVTVAAVPHALEYAVGKAEGQEILNRFLSQQGIKALYMLFIYF